MNGHKESVKTIIFICSTSVEILKQDDKSGIFGTLNNCVCCLRDGECYSVSRSIDRNSLTLISSLSTTQKHTSEYSKVVINLQLANVQ